MSHYEYGEGYIIVPGVQKSGTSTLYGLLANHPDVVASKRTETEYFSAVRDVKVSSYNRFFESSESRWRLDVSPGYFATPAAAAKIAQLLPSARLIFIFREPVARAYSAWQMQQTKGSDLRPFLDAVMNESSYIDHGRYATHLRRFLDHFPIEQMLFLRMDDLSLAPESVCGQLSTFLGIAGLSSPEIQQKNRGGVPRSALVSRALNVLFQTRNLLRVGPTAPLVNNPAVDCSTRRVRNHIAAWNRVPTEEGKPDREATHYIASALRQEMHEFSRITGWDLREWGRVWDV